jgi:hypothetical protein
VTKSRGHIQIREQDSGVGWGGGGTCSILSPENFNDILKKYITEKSSYRKHNSVKT